MFINFVKRVAFPESLSNWISIEKLSRIMIPFTLAGPIHCVVNRLYYIIEDFPIIGGSL